MSFELQLQFELSSTADFGGGVGDMNLLPWFWNVNGVEVLPVTSEFSGGFDSSINPPYGVMPFRTPLLCLLWCRTGRSLMLNWIDSIHWIVFYFRLLRRVWMVDEGFVSINMLPIIMLLSEVSWTSPDAICSGIDVIESSGESIEGILLSLRIFFIFMFSESCADEKSH